MVVASFTALCLLLLAMRLVNDMNFPLLLSCFGQPETKWIPLPYTFRQPLRIHYGYINVRTQEVRLERVTWESIHGNCFPAGSRWLLSHCLYPFCPTEILWVPDNFFFCFLFLDTSDTCLKSFTPSHIKPSNHWLPMELRKQLPVFLVA